MLYGCTIRSLTHAGVCDTRIAGAVPEVEDKRELLLTHERKHGYLIGAHGMPKHEHDMCISFVVGRVMPSASSSRSLEYSMKLPSCACRRCINRVWEATPQANWAARS